MNLNIHTYKIVFVNLWKKMTMFVGFVSGRHLSEYMTKKMHTDSRFCT